MLKPLIATALLSFCFICNMPAAWAQADVITALNQQLIPLTTLDPAASDADLQALKPFLAGKEVIGIGEATHGTHEFFLFKDRMLRFLVREMGVKVFVMEGDFAGTQLMNDYVLYGKGDVKKGLAGIGFGVWMTGEVVDMCNWLKEYNSTQTPENKVRFFGCDIQWGSAAMKLLKDELTPSGKFTPQMEDAFTAFKKSFNAINDGDKATIKIAVDSLSAIRFANGDTALVNHDVRELQQYLEYLNKKSTFFPMRRSDWRDQCMAENCQWIYNYTGHQRMMVWAHNGHICKSSGSQSLMRMGMFLAKVFGDQYYAMGFDFLAGQMRSYDRQLRQYVSPQIPPSKAGSSGALFAQCKAVNFIVDIKSTVAAAPVTKSFFYEKIPSIFLGPTFNPGSGVYYINHKLAETYDAVIFIKETTAAYPMK
jgi:erythromycin esterase